MREYRVKFFIEVNNDSAIVEQITEYTVKANSKLSALAKATHKMQDTDRDYDIPITKVEITICQGVLIIIRGHPIYN